MEYLIISPLIMIFLLFLLICKNEKANSKYNIIISIISCNRIYYLNLSISSIVNHIKLYENNLHFTFIILDQGTPYREYVVNKYNIKNVFYMNPSGYSYSFKILFTYLYTNYVLLLEEDWIVIKNIEKLIRYSNFIYTSMLILSNTKVIYGLYMREHQIGYSTKRMDQRLNITYYEVYKPWKGCCYTNGASLYKSKYLKKMGYGKTERNTVDQCIKLNYHIGYINWEYLKTPNSITYPFKHIGVKSTKIGLCNISLF